MKKVEEKKEENFCDCGNKLVEEYELNIGVCKKCQ